MFLKTDETFREAVARYGEVVSAVVMRKPDGASKGFGFVSSSEARHASAAVEALDASTHFGGSKKLYAGRAESKSERRLRGQQRRMLDDAARGRAWEPDGLA